MFGTTPKIFGMFYIFWPNILYFYDWFDFYFILFFFSNLAIFVGQNSTSMLICTLEVSINCQDSICEITNSVMKKVKKFIMYQTLSQPNQISQDLCNKLTAKNWYIVNEKVERIYLVAYF